MTGNRKIGDLKLVIWLMTRMDGAPKIAQMQFEFHRQLPIILRVANFHVNPDMLNPKEILMTSCQTLSFKKTLKMQHPRYGNFALKNPFSFRMLFCLFRLKKKEEISSNTIVFTSFT